MWELDCEESWVPKNRCFWTVVLEKTLESPLDCKEVQPVHPKETSPGCSLEEMMLRLKLQYFGHLMWRVDSLEKTLMQGGIGGRRRRGRQRMRWLDGITDYACEFEWTLGVGDGQGGLVCCNSWDCKESNTTERLKWTELKGVKNKLWRVMEGVIQMEGLRNARPLSGSCQVFLRPTKKPVWIMFMPL